jgi:hydroxyacylglutathione hydrolase
MSRIQIHVVPILEDNYGYIIEDTQSKEAVVVDPGEAGPLQAKLVELGLTLKAIWNTHHHDDHIAGNAELQSHWSGCPIVGSAGDEGRIPGLSQLLKEGDPFEFAGETVQIISIPGHTRGHIAFFFPSGHLFSGDLLFGYSCGMNFEGDLDQMYQSVSKLLPLPDHTKIYCGHEYTFNNRKFAQHVDPSNTAVTERIEREVAPPTIPLSLAVEKATNPFLRVHTKALQEWSGKTEPSEVFAEVRTRKNSFKG